MQSAEIKELLRCLPKYKTRFYYFKDRYALLLLRLAFSGETSKKELRASRYSKLLDKAVVKEVLHQSRGRALSGQDFDAYWPAGYQCYFLTLGVWGSQTRDSWYQTSRTGYNLVLQLNFSSQHDRPYRRLIDPQDSRPFEYSGHPVARPPLHTLAWSRMDIDLSSGEALVEEIQTDWIRQAVCARRLAANVGAPHYYRRSRREKALIRYVDSVLRQHEAMWDEATLAATIWFLRKEIGIRKVFYHTQESGVELKGISFSLPPRSLYTALPTKFCFDETRDAPGFLRCKSKRALARKRLERARFHFLAF